LKALKFLHSKGFVHWDVKPENLLVTDTGLLKLCDFGFAWKMWKDQDPLLTNYVATRWYRSPELVLGGDYKEGVDIWAVGCIIGEMLDG